MQGVILQTGCRPSKDDNAAVSICIPSETGSDYFTQANKKALLAGAHGGANPVHAG